MGLKLESIEYVVFDEADREEEKDSPIFNLDVINGVWIILWPFIRA
jgi:hypothetical protein